MRRRTYILTIRETYEAEVSVEAESEDEAVALYENGSVESPLHPGFGVDCVGVDILHVAVDDEA